MAMITAYIIFEEIKNFYILEIILSYQLILLYVEARELKRQGLNRYFNDVTNWFDMIQAACIITYIVKESQVI